MSVSQVSRHEASGKARCKICKHIIKKGLEQITFYGYQTSASIHGDRNICMYLKKLDNDEVKS